MLFQVCFRPLRGGAERSELCQPLGCGPPRPPRWRFVSGLARPLDADLMAELKDADRKTPLVFVCNKGLSSQEVAEHYRKQGFDEVYNLSGGVEKLIG